MLDLSVICTTSSKLLIEGKIHFINSVSIEKILIRDGDLTKCADDFVFVMCFRRMEMMLRRRDVEQWMSHRLLPEDIRKYICSLYSLLNFVSHLNWAELTQFFCSTNVGGCERLSGSIGLLPEELMRSCFLRICLMTFREI